MAIISQVSQVFVFVFVAENIRADSPRNVDLRQYEGSASDLIPSLSTIGEEGLEETEEIEMEDIGTNDNNIEASFEDNENDETDSYEPIARVHEENEVVEENDEEEIEPINLQPLFEDAVNTSISINANIATWRDSFESETEYETE